MSVNINITMMMATRLMIIAFADGKKASRWM
jgi:hypothetical protein